MMGTTLITADEIQRYLEEAGATGNGDLEEQLDAWGVDFDDFTSFVGQWTETAALRMTEISFVSALQVALVAGFEIGFRSAMEADQRRTIERPIPDALPEGFE